ncbi:unnamed protein product [Caenorhabditis auriculariae]|uniref:Glycine N-acyltransferase-like protein n=1 Tax=Caenorhabditis auriculariae TaxID=2777116 RepID=A0A8S1HBJ4_9PELO|nr:unnamed protein product [Caenorhabditis auriculariae]
MLTFHNTPQSLKKVLPGLFERDKLFVYYPVKFEIEGRFPTTKALLHSGTTDDCTYYFLNHKHTYTKDQHMMLFDGDFNGDDFTLFFHEYCKKYDFYKNMPCTLADERLTPLILEHFDAQNVKYNVEKFPFYFFYMTDEMIENMRHEKLPILPEGFRYDSVNAKEDAELMFKYWEWAEEGGLEYIRETLRRFPSVCIRKGREIVAFAAIEDYASVGRYFVFEEYRNRGFGAAIEKAIVSLAIRDGIVPNKWVETTNDLGISLTKKNSLFDHLKKPDGDPRLLDFLIFTPAS